MVGTKPVKRPSARAWRATCFIHSMVWMVSKGVKWHRLQSVGVRKKAWADRVS